MEEKWSVPTCLIKESYNEKAKRFTTPEHGKETYPHRLGYTRNKIINKGNPHTKLWPK